MTLRELEAQLARAVSRSRTLRDIRDAARASQADALLVGGLVRNIALGLSTKDVDLVAASGVSRLIALLETAWSCRAFRVRKRGVTTWRFNVDTHQVDVVDAGRRGIKEDLRRREFTFNAIAYDPLSRRLHDPLHGLADLRRGVLRLPRRGVIREDPLRALRAARFLAQYPTFRLQRSAHSEVASVSRGLRRASVERIRDELDRLLVAVSPRTGLAALEAWGLLGSILPELIPLRSCTAGKNRPDVWKHTLDALAVSAERRRLPGAATLKDPEALRVLRWGLLLHDIAKPETLDARADGRPTFHGHEILGARRVEDLLRRLRLPRALRRRVCQVVRLHLRPGHLADAGAPARGLRRLVQDAGVDLPILVAHSACDALASGGADAPARWRRLRRVLRQLLAKHEASRADPLPKLVTGRDVMEALEILPGPQVGTILREIRTLQEEGEVVDRVDALRYLNDRRLRR